MLASPVGGTRREPTAPAQRLGYQPALDGLRAVAVVAVLLYHGGVSWASGGFLGVDVFFVLSGFLITSLLVAEWQATGSVDVGSFYKRRARRLFPLLALVLLGVGVYAVVAVPKTQLHSLRDDAFATVAYFTNWHLVFQRRGYFDAFTGLSPLTHTWSLAVEEQWYLVWPLVARWLLRRGVPGRGGRELRPALVVTTLLCLASAAWMAVLHHPGADPSRVYYGTDTRAQELLGGAALGLACCLVGRFTVPVRFRVLVDGLGVAGLIAVLWLCASVNDATSWIYEGGMLLVSVLVGAVILAAVQPDGVVRRVLGTTPFRSIGLVSYGLYLWHYPVYVICSAERMGFAGNRLLLVRLVITVLVSLASYRLIERPVRERRLPDLSLLVSGAATTVVGLALVAAVAQSAPAASNPLAVSAASAAAGSGGPHDIFHYDPNQNPPPAATGGASRFVITGDSVALTLSLGFVQGSGDPPAFLWDRSVVGCQLFAGERVYETLRTDGGTQCQPWRDDRARWLARFEPDVVAVLSGVWESYDTIVHGKRLVVGTPAFDRWFSGEADRLVATVHRVGAKVAFLTPPCNARPTGLSGKQPPEDDPVRRQHLTDLYRSAAARHPREAAVIELGEFLCPGGRYQTVRDGVTLRDVDGVHFTPAGAELTRRWLFPQLQALRTR